MPFFQMKQVTLYQLVSGKKSDNADKSIEKTPTKKLGKKESDSPKYSLVKKTPQKATTPADKKTPSMDKVSPKYSLVKKTPVSPGKASKLTPKKSTPSQDLKKATTPRKTTTPKKPVQPLIVQRLVASFGYER